MTKTEVEALLNKAGIDPDARAEALSIDQWITLEKIVSP
jgi:16S rRNA A1518/A1519 N6-dimethyltransferase RsmA/KsgA/DIM1 with predicted DNA glycosylase/AP lyase activity